jgi:radical SAM superfamily enzyme YgiQ (UPF0313 family)
VAFSLHWHHQSYDVIEAARKIRKRFPDKIILLGGLTASFFAEEILKEFPFIDAIIKGDGEEPLLEILNLVSDLKRTGKLSTFSVKAEDLDEEPTHFADEAPYERLIRIPNVYLRWKDGILKSPAEVILSSEEFNRQKDYRTELLVTGNEIYPEFAGIPAMWVKGKSIDWHSKVLDRMTNIYFPRTGRGCPYQCPWCGKEKRSEVMMRDPAEVVKSILGAVEKRLWNLHFSFDPYLGSKKYYSELFDLIRKEFKNTKTNFPAYFECWGLPSTEFIDDFKNTFYPGTIAISPGSGSETIRKKCKHLSYSNNELIKTVKYIQNKNIEMSVFFSIGSPGENEEHFKLTADLIRKLDGILQIPMQQNISDFISSVYKGLTPAPVLHDILLFGLDMEPGAPWFTNPGDFGIETDRKGFLDFYRAHGPEGRGSFTSQGYRIPGFFADPAKSKDVRSFEDSILELRCKTSCAGRSMIKREEPDYIQDALYKEMSGKRDTGGACPFIPVTHFPRQ